MSPVTAWCGDLLQRHVRCALVTTGDLQGWCGRAGARRIGLGEVPGTVAGA